MNKTERKREVKNENDTDEARKEQETQTLGLEKKHPSNTTKYHSL